MNPKFNASLSVNLPNGTELDLGGTKGSVTDTVLVINLPVFDLVKENPSDLAIFMFIFNLLHFHPNLSISGLFPEAIST